MLFWQRSPPKPVQIRLIGSCVQTFARVTYATTHPSAYWHIVARAPVNNPCEGSVTKRTENRLYRAKRVEIGNCVQTSARATVRHQHSSWTLARRLHVVLGNLHDLLATDDLMRLQNLAEFFQRRLVSA